MRPCFPSLLFSLSIVCPLQFLTNNLHLKLFSIINFFILIFEFLDVSATYIFVPRILTNLPTIQFPLFFWVILSIKRDSSVLPQMEKVILHFMYHLMKHTFLYFNKLLPPTLFLLHRTHVLPPTLFLLYHTHVLPPTYVFTYSSLFLVGLSLTLLHLCLLLYLQVLLYLLHNNLLPI